MAKKSSTVHLELSTWDEIEQYREEYGITRNEAIERMFTERRLLLKTMANSKTENKIEEKKAEVKEKSAVDTAIKNNFDDMPD